MTTYKDHPLAHLVTVCHEGLNARADIWEKKGLRVRGLDVAQALRNASTTLKYKRDAIESILEGSNAGKVDGLSQSALSAHRGDDLTKKADINHLRTVARWLRVGDSDPHGGSTAGHLELAAHEIEHLDNSLKRLARLAENGSIIEAVRTEALTGLRRLVAEPTHAAPVSVM